MEKIPAFEVCHLLAYYCTKCILIVRITLPTVLKIRNCSYADQLYNKKLRLDFMLT